MDWFKAFILGCIQGVTEFIPVSSSTHLKIAKYLFDIKAGEEQIFFDLVCHLGTLIALIWYLREDIKRLFTDEKKQLRAILIALLPLMPCYILLKPVRDLFSQIHFLGIGLCVTSLLLFTASQFHLKRKGCFYRDALLVGIMQGVSLLPGISRSGATISTGRILGWEMKRAVRFSFLLAIPTITGGNLFTFIKLNMTQPQMPSFTSLLIGFLSSLGVGAVTVRYALPLLERGVLKPFAWYCLSIGLLITALLFFYD